MVSLLFFLLAIILYYLAPSSYSQEFSLVVFTTYTLSAVYTIWKNSIKSDYFNFFSLFFLSFLFVNFVYPVFLFPISPTYFSVFKFGFDYAVIPKCTALAYLGSSSFGLGASILPRVRKSNRSGIDEKVINVIFWVTILSVMAFVLIILIAGGELLSGRFGATDAIPPALLVVFQVLIGLFLILLMKRKPLKIFIASHFIGSLVILFFVFVFTYVGDRGPIIQIIVIGIGAYSLFINSISAKKMVLIAVLGAFALTFVSYARSKTASTSGTSFIQRGTENFQLNSALDVGMDLIVNNRNLYVGYQIANEKGHTNGSNLLYFILAPVPMAPSWVSNILYDADPAELTSSNMITKQASATYGLGTNLIADLYIAFGEVAVVLFMFFLGWVVKYVYNKSLLGNNLNHIILYLFLLSFAIYLPRTTILDPFRHMMWALIIFNTAYSLSNLKYFVKSK